MTVKLKNKESIYNQQQISESSNKITNQLCKDIIIIAVYWSEPSQMATKQIYSAKFILKYNIKGYKLPHDEEDDDPYLNV